MFTVQPTGKPFLILKLDTDDKTQAMSDVTKMCEELLANTVIEDYEIKLT